jgi:diguanylate cyclase (GGDEF)-like protein
MDMSEEVQRKTTKLADHETFQESIQELDRSLKKSVEITSLEILTLLGAMIFPWWFNDISNGYLCTVSVVDGFLLLLCFSRGYDLLRCRQTRLILAKQMEIAAKQRARTDKLYGLSILDPLTGLHNRRFGEQRLLEEIVRSESSSEPLAAVLFDLDYFKEINDEFGHAVGDLALKEFSRRLRRAIRSCDVPVRIGGDEFLVILPECPRDKVDTILARIGSPEIEVTGQKISIQYSTGRAHYQYNDTMEALLGRADQSLYAEKAARPKRLDPAKPAVESMPRQGAENPKIRSKHALTLEEVSWERY